jgi:hypothetical protein
MRNDRNALDRSGTPPRQLITSVAQVIAQGAWYQTTKTLSGWIGDTSTPTLLLKQLDRDACTDFGSQLTSRFSIGFPPDLTWPGARNLSWGHHIPPPLLLDCSFHSPSL